MANGQISTARPQLLAPFIALFAAASLAVLGLVLVKSPTDVLFLLTAVIGVVVAFMRPDWFLYFILFTIPIDFARAVHGFPIAVEETYVFVFPLIVLHRLAGGKVVRRLRLYSVYAWPVLALFAMTATFYFRGQSRYGYIKGMGRFAESVSIAWAVLNLATTWDRLRKMIYSLLGGALVISVLVFCQIIARNPTWFVFFVRGTTSTAFSPTHVGEASFLAMAWTGRGMGLSGPSGTGIFLEMLLPLAFYRLLVAERKLWHYLMLAVLWGGILLTFTAVPILAAFATSMLLVLLMRKFNWRLVLAVAFTAGVSGFILMQSYVERKVVSHVKAIRYGELYQRLDLWKMGWRLFEKHPLVGIGPRVGAYFILRWGQFWQTSALSLMNHPHETYILIADTFGVPGLICYGWIWFRALQLGYRALRDRSLGPRRFEAVAIACAVVAWLIQGFTDSVLAGGEQLAILTLLEAAYLLVQADRKDSARAKGVGQRAISQPGGPGARSNRPVSALRGPRAAFP